MLTVLNKFFVSFDVAESNVFCYFSIADRTKFQRLFVIFFNAIEAIHEAVVVDTVSDTEHMPDFMYHRSERRIEDLVPINLVFFSRGKVLVPSHKRKDAYAGFILGPTVDVVPTVSWIDIFESDSHNTVGVFGNSLFHIG